MNLETFLKLEQDDILNIPFKVVINDKERVVDQLTVGDYIKIHPLLITISKNEIAELNIIAKENKIEDFPALFENNIEAIRGIIEIIYDINNEDFEGLKMKEVFVLIASIMARMGTKDFLQSIIAGDAISRSNRAGIIAAEKFLTL